MGTQAKDVDTCENGDVNGSRVRETQERLIGGRAATQLARTFSALSDPTLLRNISALSHNEMCVHDLAATVGISQSAVSHQLRSLREMRLVRFRKEGRHVHYTLDDEHVHSLFDQALNHIEHE